MDGQLYDWLAGEIAQQFAVAEGAAFTTGDGTTKPKGFLSYTNANTVDGTRAFGQIQYVPTGAAADFAATTPADALFDLVYSLKAQHRAGACFQMSKMMLNKIRKFKTSTNEYLWTENTAGDGGLDGAVPGRLLGYPVFENEDMASAVGAGALVIAFGNFKNGYTIVDRTDLNILRDPYTDKPYVNFYTTKRTGGMLTDSEAIKILKCSAN
jgi:HK97 family phage major capsid protein